MKGFPTQKEYLFLCGILETGSPEDIQAYKKYYRKEYLKWKKQEYVKKHKVVRLSFPNKEAARLAKKAATYNRSLPDFLKSTIRAYEQQAFLFPKNSEVRQLRIELRRIGNNINQVSKAYNGGSLTQATAVSNLRHHLKEIDTLVRNTLEQPKSFEAFITEALEKDRRLRPKLKRLVQELCL